MKTITLLTASVALLSLLASCQSSAPTTTASGSASTKGQNDKLSGHNTLAQVQIKTTGEDVTMSGTTVAGKRVRSRGRNIDQAVDNLGNAATN